MYRIPNPSYRPAQPVNNDTYGFNPLMGICDGSNPRILQQFYVDPPECVCRACPTNWTSDGGNPSSTACRPIIIPHYFLLEVEVAVSKNSPQGFNLTGQADITHVRLGRQMIDQISQKISKKAPHLEHSLYGPVLRRNIGGNTAIFSSVHSFKTSWQNQERGITLFDAFEDNCFDLSSAGACGRCQAAVEVDVCGAARSVLGGDGITLYGLALKFLDVPPGNSKPVRVSA